MKLTDIKFKDEAFRRCVMATGADRVEQVTELRCRREKITDISGIECLTELKLLDLTRNQLTRVNLAKNTKLQEVFLGNNAITDLDVSGCVELIHLEVFMNELEQIDVSNNTKLEELWADLNDLETVDLSQLAHLEDLRISNNNLTELDVSCSPHLVKLIAKENPLSDIARGAIAAMAISNVQF